MTSLRPAKGLNPGDAYTAVGLVSNASVDDLDAAGTDYPSWVTDRYLQLPDDLPPAVSNLAHQLTQADRVSDSSPYYKASVIEGYLRSFPVELDDKAPPSNSDAVAYFLFDRQRGHPLYHASAMVVLLRTLGVPARLAVGFALPQVINNVDFAYHVDGRNAQAWPEVYFPGFGWIPFSPSSAYPAATTSPAIDSPAGPAGPISPQELLDMFPNACPRRRRDTASKPRHVTGGERLRWADAPVVDRAAAGPRGALAGLRHWPAICLE